MNARGQYGNNNASGRVQVGAFLVHTLEMRQRYNNVKTVAVQALLNELSREGVATSTASNRWEIALKEGPWIILAWHPESNALEVTITDRELRPVDQLASTRSRYEALLNRITPRLQTFGATTVGAAIVGQAPVQAPAPHATVGLTLYHSVGDRADAVKAMALDWDALYQNLASQAGELVRDPTTQSGYRIMTQREWDANPPDPNKVTWFKSYALPLIKQWVKFKHDQIGGDRTVADDYISFAERFQTNWDVYEDWRKKLDNLRAEAEKRGFTIEAPKPQDLPTSV